MKSLFKSLRDHFIPHEGNAHQPHFLRRKAAVGILLFIVTLEAFYLAQTLIILPSNSSFAAIFASVLVDQTNQNRKTEQLGTLITSPILEKAAHLKVEDMARKGYFSHNSPDGKTPWYWFEQAGYDYAAAGENLAVNFTDSKDVTEAWMHSPGHRANIMNGNYTEIGIATAEGTYKGKRAIFVVQEFGRPSLIARQTESTMTATKTPEITSNTFSPASTVKPKVSITTAKILSKPKIAPAPPSQTTPTTTVVAGSETTKLDAPITLAPTNIVPQRSPTKTEMLLVAPRTVTTTIYLIIAALLTIMLGLTVFIKIRIQYPHIIMNGILLLAITLSFTLLNAALGFARGVI